jgi:hypothetical protein
VQEIQKPESGETQKKECRCDGQGMFAVGVVAAAGKSIALV